MVEKGVLHSAARPRLLCRGDGDGRKGGTSLGRELGLRRVARFSLAHKKLLRKSIPVARRVLGENHDLTLRIRGCYAEALYKDGGAALHDLREAVTTLEDTTRIARRVFGGAHPLTEEIKKALQEAGAALRKTPSA